MVKPIQTKPLQTTESVNSIYRASDTTEDQWKKDQIRTRIKIDVCMKHLLYHVVVMRKWKTLKHHFIYLIWTQGLTVSKTSSSLYSRLWIKAWYWPCVTMYYRLWKNCNVTKPMTHDHPILLTVKCPTWRLFLAANFRPYRAKLASNARGMPGERRGGGGGVINFLGTD